MGSVSRRIMPLLVAVLLAGCNGVGTDLSPSGADRRPPVTPGTTGPSVGQIAPDFTLPDTLGDNVALSTSLPGRKGVVLYFTMWCVICGDEMSHMRSAIMPAHPDVGFFAIDYVSGTVADARASELSNGFANSGFTVLVDLGNPVLHAYAATMGTTVVIDNTGIVRMNENYGTGSRLQAILGGL